MTAAAPLAFDADPLRTYDSLELSALVFGRFSGIATDAAIEVCSLPPSQKLTPHVAYATSMHECVRLMREAKGIPRSTGCYLIANQIKPEVAARYPVNRWQRADAGRAADHEVEKVRLVYVDCDAQRIKGISSTDAEKRAAYDLSKRVEDFLISRLGDDHALGRGDSGNGYSIFVALEPFSPSKETGERIERFLKTLAVKFDAPGAKIDTTVFNPARLCPAFGTLKTKGSDTTDRPHRDTFFSCRPTIRRVPLEVLA